jgi:hypothetical protein
VPQIAVDPNNRGALVNAPVVSTVPPHVRKFGFIPNFRECLPGDLILSRSVSSSVLGDAITHAQRGFAREHAQWTHAAVFLYEDKIVEAVPFHGIRTRSLYADVPARVLRVRRRRDLLESERYKIALRALTMLGSRYNFWAALSIGWQSTFGIQSRLGALSFGPVIICSRVFHDAYVEITRTLLHGCSIDMPIMPAHLSATDDLDDVDVGWIQLP